jgi:hypothetical protein
MADTPTAITQYQTGFAPEIAPYGQALLGQGAALTNVNTNPYMQYQGDQVAQFTPLQQQSYQNAALMQTAPQLQDATAMAGTAGLGGLNTQYTFNPSNFTAANARSMMNPYTDVMDAQARKNAAIAQQQQQAQAATSGAFGGSGDYLMRGQNNANLQNQLGQNQYNAFQNAQQQYNTQNQLNAQQQQFGANLGLQGLNTALQGANTLGQLGTNQYNQNLGITGLQNQLGGQQQQQVQNVLNNQYQNYLSAQNYPYQQLNFMSNLIRGLPMTQQSASVYQAPPSMLSQVAGLGLGVAGLSKLKDGGVVQEPTSNGIIDLAMHKMEEDYA